MGRVSQEHANAYMRKWWKTPRGRYAEQRNCARKRGIPFLLTFGEWWQLWEPHWPRRGSRPGGLVMARAGDAGAYEIGNVKIIAYEANRAEQTANGRCTGPRRIP